MVTITGDSQEAVAYALFIAIAHAQDKAHPEVGGKNPIDEQWILDTYRKCLSATIGNAAT